LPAKLRRGSRRRGHEKGISRECLAGNWREGTDLKQQETAGVRRVERGQRQYALFAGLNEESSACGHVSENGAGSFRNRYALHKCHSAAVSPAVPADAPALNRSLHIAAAAGRLHEHHGPLHAAGADHVSRGGPHASGSATRRGDG
jgi:hypothetical protein